MLYQDNYFAVNGVINLNGVINMVLYQNLAFTAHEKKNHEKSYLKTIHLRYSSHVERKISII